MKITYFLMSVSTIALSIAVTCSICHADPLRLTRDINPGTGNGSSIYAFPTTDYLLFWGIDGTNGNKGNPWRSDGTTSGTALIKTIAGSSALTFPSPFSSVNGISLFNFTDGITGNQLWRTDGTAGGTFTLTSNPSNTVVSSQFPMGNTLFFVISCGTGLTCMYSTDGTAAPVAVLPGAIIDEVPHPIATLQKIVFEGNIVGGTSFGIYVSDGTNAASTEAVSTTTANNIGQFVAVNDKFFFPASDSANGNELWVSDAAIANSSDVPTLGTRLTLDINPTNPSSNPQNLTRVGDLLFFTALDPDAGRELWRSDGTTTGTFRIMDIGPEIADAKIPFIVAFKPASGPALAFFPADDGVHGLEPWVSDGTPAGTFMLKDIAAGSNASMSSGSLIQVAITANELYFSAADGGNTFDSRVWMTDGTSAGTVKTDAVVTSAAPVAAANGRVFATGTAAATGNELYQLDALSHEVLAPHGSAWCVRPEKTVLDNDTITSTFSLPAHGGITNMDFVSLDLFHTYVGDLIISLTHEETGTKVTLLNRESRVNGVAGSCGGTKGNIVDISLTDSATDAVNGSCVSQRLAFPLNAAFQPVEPLGAFKNESVKGHWTLTVTDAYAKDAGTFHQWCMGFQHDYIFADGLQ